MRFNMRDMVLDTLSWKPAAIIMIYENGVGNYIELQYLDGTRSLRNHQDLELLKKLGKTITIVDAMNSGELVSDFEDTAFRESLEKKPSRNLKKLVMVWLFKRLFL